MLISKPITILDQDFLLEADVTVTYPGHPGTRPSLSDPGSPSEAMEYVVNEVWLARDKINLDLPAWLSAFLGTYVEDYCYDEVERAYNADR